MTVEITSVEALETFTQYPESVVMFGATWCNPCKQFRPVFDKASEAAEDVPFGIVYVDTLEGVSELDMFKKHSIQSVPTVRLYREGEETSLRERRIFPFLQELAEARA